MRFREFIREENYGEAANIDWEKFRAGMTALAMDQKELQGYQGVDAIVFLGLMGDPSPRSRSIDIRLQGPARIVVLNDAGVDLLGKISGMYLDPNHTDYRDYPNRPESDGRAEQRRALRKNYDIAVSHKHFDPAFHAFKTDALDTLAHEARHRGFRILWDTPAIRDRVPEPLRTEMTDQISGRDSIEHLMIYAVSMPPTEGSAIGPDRFFRSKEEYYKYRKDYKIIERAAKSYVMNMKVTPGGLAALRNEVDKMTPKDEVIKIVPGPAGAVAVGTTPIIKGIVDKVKGGIDKVSGELSQGANIVADKVKQGVDKVKSALDIGTTPAQPSSSKKPDQTSWYDSLLARIKKNAGLGSETYIIKDGDTLRKIAEKNNVSVDALFRANPQIKNPDAIYAGDELIIP
jgi:LysM repeat protein